MYRTLSSTCLAILSIMSAVVPAQAQPKIYVYDLQWTSSLPADQRYDQRHAAVCIQGLANRDAPRVFLKFHGDDDPWLNRLQETGGLCEGWSIEQIDDLDELLDTFRAFVNGVILYSPDADNGVISTSLVATTAAGIENGIAIRKDLSSGSLCNYLVNDPDGPQLPVLLDLTGKFTGSGTIWQTDTPSTGSAKCDAYIWAKEKYIDTGLCDPTVLMYTMDLWGLKLELNHYTQLSNLDYAISRKGFCFELSPWGDEVPNDDPTQPLGTDLDTFETILDACNQQTQQTEMIKYCGFINWPYKYTNWESLPGNHSPVATEWRTVYLLTAYNVYTEADAIGGSYISNSSFYGGLKPEILQRTYVQNPPPTYDDMVNQGLIDGNGNVPEGNYVMLGLGDYDQATWVLYWLAGQRYQDNQRGQVDCNWGVDPNAVDRSAVAMDYMFRHKTSRDFFMGWDSGCGYINPSQLHGNRDPSGYTSGVGIWQQHCRHYYQLFDYSISAWLLNGSMTLTLEDYQNYLPFSPDGIGHHHGEGGFMLVDNVPVQEIGGDLGDANGDDPVIDDPDGVNFAWYRTVLWWPNDVKQKAQEYASSGHNHHFLDAYTYYYLLRYREGGNNNYRTSYTGHTIPRLMTTGASVPVTVTVRNDGWDTWTNTSEYGLSYAWNGRGMPSHSQIVVDNDGRHSMQERQGSIRLQAGKHPIKVDYFNAIYSGDLEVYYEGPGLAKQEIPNSALFLEDDIQTNGLNYEYYAWPENVPWFYLPPYDQYEPDKTGVVTNFDLSPAEQPENFGFRYRGYVEVPADGLYTFYTNSDDGSRLWVNGITYEPPTALPTGQTINPGQSVTFNFNIVAPAETGEYDLYFDMVHDGNVMFHEEHNLEWKKPIVVADDTSQVDTDGDGRSDLWEQANGTLFWHPDDTGPEQAFNPIPADEATEVSIHPILNWTAGAGALLHHVYFGTNPSPAYQGEFTETSFDPGTLESNKMYYWRVDEENLQGTITGETWQFTTRLRASDFDSDGDVDLEDFGFMQKCRSGAYQSYPTGCEAADLDGDGDVDTQDFDTFRDCLSGSNIPAAGNCQ